jgi:hypothetical protein
MNGPANMSLMSPSASRVPPQYRFNALTASVPSAERQRSFRQNAAERAPVAHSYVPGCARSLLWRIMRSLAG